MTVRARGAWVSVVLSEPLRRPSGSTVRPSPWASREAAPGWISRRRTSSRPPASLHDLDGVSPGGAGKGIGAGIDGVGDQGQRPAGGDSPQQAIGPRGGPVELHIERALVVRSGAGVDMKLGGALSKKRLRPGPRGEGEVQTFQGKARRMGGHVEQAGAQHLGRDDQVALSRPRKRDAARGGGHPVAGSPGEGLGLQGRRGHLQAGAPRQATSVKSTSMRNGKPETVRVRQSRRPDPAG